MTLAGLHLNVYTYQNLIVLVVVVVVVVVVIAAVVVVVVVEEEEEEEEEKARVFPLWSPMTRKLIDIVTGKFLLKEYAVTIMYFASFRD
jgi:flagellar basal body-associated protein FliL